MPDEERCICQDAMPAMREQHGHSDEYEILIVCTKCGRSWEVDQGQARLVGLARAWIAQ